jgi:hypothetical protein
VDHDDRRPDNVEILEGGARRGSVLSRLPRHRWLLFVGILAVIAVTLILRASGTPSASRAPRSPRVTTAPTVPGFPSAPSTAVPSGPAVVVTTVGHPLLGVRGRWELFGRGDGYMLRIQLATGRITRTAVPELRSSGPVSFVVGPTQADIRPIDAVPGYVVPDGRPARRLSGSLGSGGPLFPGPDVHHVWVTSRGGRHAHLTLSTLNGRGSATSIPVPRGGSALAGVSDDTGYVVLPGVGGYYDARPDGLHRITRGALLASGAKAWLVRDRARDHDAPVDIDRATGARQVVRVRLSAAPIGAIAPDGDTAAMFKVGRFGTVHLFLLDLRSGSEHVVRLSIDQAVAAGTVVWSSDSRWLFAVGATGRLYAIDGHTGRVRRVAAVRPRLSQLAIRSSPPR